MRPGGCAPELAAAFPPAVLDDHAPSDSTDAVDGGQELVLEDLTREQVREWRVRAMKDHQVAFDHIDQDGETSARRLFSNQLVDQAQRLSGLGHLNLGYPLGFGMSGKVTGDLPCTALVTACKNGGGVLPE